MMIRSCCPQDIYNATSLKDTPFYAIAGNHDHGGNVSAQIAYSGVQSRWKCKCSRSPPFASSFGSPKQRLHRSRLVLQLRQDLH